MSKEDQETETTAASKALPSSSGSPWSSGGHPAKKGWYVTRTDEGFLKWRAWGRGCWWSQQKDGWLGHYNGEGEASLYDFQHETRQDISLDVWDLPPLENIEHERDAQT